MSERAEPGGSVITVRRFRTGRSRRPAVLAALVVAIVVIAVLATVTATRAGPQPPSPLASVAPNPGAISPISVAGDRIVREGQPWWFVGYNSFVWSGNCGNADEKMSAQDVDQWFASMRHDGHGAVRLFFFPGWNIDRLDAAVASARKYGVYLTITLDDAIGDCGESEKNAAWFADPTERAAYARHMTMLLQRYRGEPAIAWFEYFNEPRDAGGALRPFLDQMGAAADRVDPDRLFASGTVAPYSFGGEEGFRTISASPGVDIASLHEYDENEAESHHGPSARRAAAGKPVIVGEFGVKTGPGCAQDDSARAYMFRDKAEAYTAAGYAGALAWAWQPGGTGGCEYGNLDTDAPAQEVLRTVGQ